MKAVLKYSWRVVVAGALLTALFFISRRLLYRFEEFPQAAVSSRVLLVWLFLSSLLVAGVLAYPTVRSRWSGTQLMSAIFVAHFGVYTFINQSEALVVVERPIAAPMAALLVAHGFLVALLFSLLLVFIMGRAGEMAFVSESGRLHLPPREWLWKLAACCLTWVSLYIVLFAPGGDFPSWHTIAMQTARALLLVVFVLPAIKMMKGERLETALTIGFLLAGLGGVAPVAVRHVFEQLQMSLADAIGEAVSNLAYGFLVGYLFSRQPARI